MVDNVSLLQGWENAIREVNEYFSANSANLNALRGSQGKVEKASKTAGADRLKSTQRSVSDLELDKFEHALVTHMKYKGMNFSALDMNKTFAKIYAHPTARTAEEQLLVQEAMAALSPEEFQNALKANCKVSDVIGMIDRSNLSKVVDSMAEYAEQRKSEQMAAAVSGNDRLPSQSIWDDLGHILDKLTSALTSGTIGNGLDSQVKNLDLTPSPTPAKKSDPSGKAPGIG